MGSQRAGKKEAESKNEKGNSYKLHVFFIFFHVFLLLFLVKFIVEGTREVLSCVTDVHFYFSSSIITQVLEKTSFFENSLYFSQYFFKIIDRHRFIVVMSLYMGAAPALKDVFLFF